LFYSYTDVGLILYNKRKNIDFIVFILIKVQENFLQSAILTIKLNHILVTIAVTYSHPNIKLHLYNTHTFLTHWVTIS